MPKESFAALPALAQQKKVVDRELRHLLRAERGIPRRLRRAMEHSLFSGGKRMRPALLLWTYDAVRVGQRRSARSSRSRAMAAACAVEMIHTYSLIHDDLPAMDDDVLRRGQPTCHVAFDEATAILAGDALQALAFTVLARVGGAGRELVAMLGDAAGPAGMIGGQQEDLLAEGADLSAALVRRIHQRKTAALIAASMGAGAWLAGCSAVDLAVIRQAGRDLGMAFQGVDDVLDATASTDRLGKSTGKDAAAGKATWIRLEGLPKAVKRAERHGRKGMGHLRAALPEGRDTEKLLGLAALMWNRDR